MEVAVDVGAVVVSSLVSRENNGLIRTDDGDWTRGEVKVDGRRNAAALLASDNAQSAVSAAADDAAFIVFVDVERFVLAVYLWCVTEIL